MNHDTPAKADVLKPVLYSFRRCPYAMRARLALRSSTLAYEHREIALKDKPAHMLALSPKGTVPVLCWLDKGKVQVCDESLDIMLWALRQHDPEAWLPASPEDDTQTMTLIANNDGAFKSHLDRYKYPQRFGIQDGFSHRAQGAVWLEHLDHQLQQRPFLSGQQWGLADAAIAPFVRQFAHVQPEWFANQAWPSLIQWLHRFETSEAFAAVMQKQPLWTETLSASGDALF